MQRKLAVEAIGTFFLMFTIGMAAANAGALAPLAIGAVLMVMVFAGGHISGAHYNPAVSLAVFVRREMRLGELGPYVATQVAAATVAGFVITILGFDADQAANPDVAKALVAEFLFTFALAWVVLNVATARGTDGNSFYGLAIGFTVLAGAFAVGPVSGAAFNPAVAVGAMIVGLLSWSDIWIYLLATLAGGAAAGAAFLYVEPGDHTDVRAADPDPYDKPGDAPR